MTINQRKRQLERRKDIACGFLTIAFVGAMLGGCWWVASNADKGINEALETEVETEVYPVVEIEPTEVFVSVADIPIVELGTEKPTTEEVTEVETETEEVVEIVPEETPEVEKKSYTEDDVNRLAHLIFAEVGSNKNSDMLLYACGQVVLNRVRSNKYPNSIKAVIAQKNVYSTRNSYMKRKPTERCFRIARELLEGKKVVGDDCFGQSFYGTFKRYGKKCHYKENRVYIYSLKEK